MHIDSLRLSPREIRTCPSFLRRLPVYVDLAGILAYPSFDLPSQQKYFYQWYCIDLIKTLCGFTASRKAPNFNRIPFLMISSALLPINLNLRRRYTSILVIASLLIKRKLFF